MVMPTGRPAKRTRTPLDIREQVANETYVEPKPPRRKLFPPGLFRRTGIRLASLVLIAVLLLGGYFVFNYVQVSGSAGENTTQRVDAIVVLGAAQYNGAPSYVLAERLDHAYNLYREYDEGDRPYMFTTGAGAEGDVTTEGLVGYGHLRSKTEPVVESDIKVIPEGSNTWEQLSAVAHQVDVLQIDSVLLVSDSYHTYRLLAIADELGIEAYVSPSAVDPDLTDYIRETAAVSIGRITGYRRLSSFTEDG